MPDDAIKRYCLQCQYDLSGLEEHRCPECGKAFNPGDENTWQTHRDQMNQESVHWDFLASFACLLVSMFSCSGSGLIVSGGDIGSFFLCLILLVVACVGLHYSVRLVVHARLGWWLVVGFLLLMLHAIQAIICFLVAIVYWPLLS